MPTAMLEYTKVILNKVSFDTSLFCKEVKKALQRLMPYEIEEIKMYIQLIVQQNPNLDVCLIHLEA